MLNKTNAKLRKGMDKMGNNVFKGLTNFGKNTRMSMDKSGKNLGKGIGKAGFNGVQQTENLFMKPFKGMAEDLFAGKVYSKKR